MGGASKECAGWTQLRVTHHQVVFVVRVGIGLNFVSPQAAPFFAKVAGNLREDFGRIAMMILVFS